jgi:hypothetical protein
MDSTVSNGIPFPGRWSAAGAASRKKKIVSLSRTAQLPTLTHVDGGLNPELVAQVEQMLREGFIEGLTISLRHKYPTLAEEAGGAVAHAVEKLIIRGTAPDQPRNYLASSAYNDMKRTARRQARLASLDAEAESPSPRQFADKAWTVEEQALIDEAYKELKTHVEMWETDHVRVVTLLYLEAAYRGEPLASTDAAQLTGDILGEEIDAAFVRTWWSRGKRRLKDYVVAKEAGDAGLED